MRFSTPESCSSIGAATVFASVSALAPGYDALIVTVGGAISGYCDTGRPNAETRPAIRMTIESTLAKIGRSMKKREKLPMARPYFVAPAGAAVLAPAVPVLPVVLIGAPACAAPGPAVGAAAGAAPCGPAPGACGCTVAP